MFDADLEEFSLIEYSDTNNVSKKSGRQLWYDDGPQPPDYLDMTPMQQSKAEELFTWTRKKWCAAERRKRMANEYNNGRDRSFTVLGLLMQRYVQWRMLRMAPANYNTMTDEGIRSANIGENGKLSFKRVGWCKHNIPQLC
jgi:hypothetical protein